MNASFRVAGGRELAQNLARLPASVSTPIKRRALRAAAEPMRRDMEVLAPHEPGAPDLQKSMTISNVRTGTDLLYESEVAVAVGPSKDAFYGFFQEYGTVDHGAQPFARPAFDQNIQRSLAILATMLWAAIAKRRGPVTGIASGPGRTV